MGDTRADATLLLQIRGGGFPPVVREHVFHPVRKWRLDYAWPTERIAIEIDGGIWMGGAGAHSRPQNIMRDMDKHNEAQLLGWLVLRITPSQVRKGEAFDILRRAFEARGIAIGLPDVPKFLRAAP